MLIKSLVPVALVIQTRTSSKTAWACGCVCPLADGSCFAQTRTSTGSLLFGVWVLLVEYGTLDSSGDDFVCGRNAWFDSGYGVCDSTWLLDEFHTISTSTWTLILRFLSPFSHRMEKCAQPMLQCSVFVCELALGKLDIISTSFTWLRRVIMDNIFRLILKAFAASSSESRPGVSGLPIHLDDLWTYTCCLRARVQNNNNKNNILLEWVILRIGFGLGYLIRFSALEVLG